ncbi:hypothetical protein INT47_001407 [Mucor saturninus]|uniref:Uncharacterized protein n=1 Tax=Mucor saturninus TaxID=64648 RepID=A0A8H7QYU6_9FUNG|nr:hypothetical protein INT47_001407 [Mucor saturninus]
MLQLILYRHFIVLSLFVTACLGNSYYHHKYKRETGGTLATRRYFVELHQKADFSMNSFIDYTNTHSDNVIIQKKITHKFLNAISIEIKEVDNKKEHVTLKQIMDHLDVKSVSPVQIIKSKAKSLIIKDSIELSPRFVELLSPHRLSQVDKVHNELKLNGEGVFIGVIDTGIDYNHPALGGGFGPGFKVQAGYDLVGNDYDGYSKTIRESKYPLDNCPKGSESYGHGTHVSGIIAGYDPTNNFSGVAPGAKLGHWRVGGCSGMISTDIITEAFLMAYDAGVDVISMSIGDEYPWALPNTLLSKLIERITENGVSVVIASGNGGLQGIYTVGYPSTSTSALSVGSVLNEYHYFDCNINAIGISKPIACNFPKNSTTDIKSTRPLIDGYLAINDGKLVHACKNISENVKGKIVMVPINRTACVNLVQIQNIYKAGAIGAVFVDVELKGSLDNVAPNSFLPVTIISKESSDKLLNAFHKNSNLLLKFSDDKSGYISRIEQFASTASYFTSLGPTGELNFGPEIAAVGESVFSTLPITMGSWGIYKGTSMACPYVAGSIGLYLQKYGTNKTRTSVVYETFQNYAFQPNFYNRTSGILDNPLRVGAGVVQVYDAITQTTHITPSKISFNDTSSAIYKTQTLTITNNGLTEINYTLFNNVSMAISPYDRAKSGYTLLEPANNVEAPANLKFSESEIYLKPGQSRNISVTVIPPDTDPLDHIMYGGFIQFYPTNNNNAPKPLHIPYFGVVGNQKDIPIFVMDDDHFATATSANTSLLYQLNDTVIVNQTRSDFVAILMRITMPSSIMKGEVLSSNRVLGEFEAYGYIHQTYAEDYSNVIYWDGGYYKEAVSNDILRFGMYNYSDHNYTLVDNGSYHLRVSALRLFGNVDDIDDWDSFTAGPFVVKSF